MNGRFRIDWHGVSDVGSVRAVNEDSLLGLPERRLWVVADGMGGHAGGDWASARLTTGFAVPDQSETLDDGIKRCAEAIHAANADIWQEAQRRGTQMGSTVVALLLDGDRFAVIWAGDSRAYLWRGGQLMRLTRDHSQVQAMIDHGLLREEDGLGHPMAHVLARAVGVEPTLALDVVTDAINPDDRFLLTSDGVHGVLSDHDMAAIVGQTPLGQAADRLVAAGIVRGSRDNLTALIVGLHETTLLRVGDDCG